MGRVGVLGRVGVMGRVGVLGRGGADGGREEDKREKVMWWGGGHGVERQDIIAVPAVTGGCVQLLTFSRFPSIVVWA